MSGRSAGSPGARLRAVGLPHLLGTRQPGLGQPLRATISADFVGVEPRAKQSALDKIFSADLTHLYLVKAAETLHMISKKVYGDSKYYMEIARVNRLRNFRRLKPGMELILPPLDKRER